MTYTQNLKRTESQEVATVEDHLTLPKILEVNGISWASLPPAEAMAVGLQLVDDNREEYGHSGTVQKHPKMQLLDKYFYVISGGLTKKKRMEKGEELSKDAGDDKAIAKMGQEGALSLPGPASASAASSSSIVKEEFPGTDEFRAKLAGLKTSLASLQKLLATGPPLQKRFEFMGKKEEAMRLVGVEMKDKQDNLAAFVDKALTVIVECDSTTDGEDKVSLLPALRDAGAACDAHLAGCREMFARYRAMAR